LKFTTGKLWRSEAGRWEEVPVVPRQPPLKPDWPADKGPGAVMGNQFAAFLRAIRTGEPPEVSGWDGREVGRVLEATEESARTGREVRLEPGARLGPDPTPRPPPRNARRGTARPPPP